MHKHFGCFCNSTASNAFDRSRRHFDHLNWPPLTAVECRKKSRNQCKNPYVKKLPLMSLLASLLTSVLRQRSSSCPFLPTETKAADDVYWWIAIDRKISVWLLEGGERGIERKRKGSKKTFQRLSLQSFIGDWNYNFIELNFIVN